jgi:hypothetical protein
MCRVSSDGGRQKVAKAIWQFHPSARRHVFDAVLKHGWPSAPCHGANMAGKKPASYRCIAMAIEIAIDLPAFFVAVVSLSPTTIAK